MLVLLSCFFFHFMCVPFLFRSSFASSSTRLSHCPRTILYPWRSTWISSLVVRPSTKVLRSLCPLVVWAQTQARFFVRWGCRKHHEIFLIEIHIKSSETFVISALFNYVPAVAKSKHEYWYHLVHQGYYEFLMTRFWFALWENETAFWIWICVGKSSRRCLIGKCVLLKTCIFWIIYIYSGFLHSNDL